MLVTAATDRFYADMGHALDFINKSFEMLDLIGWEHAASILPTTVRQLVAARGGEEIKRLAAPDRPRRDAARCVRGAARSGSGAAAASSG